MGIHFPSIWPPGHPADTRVEPGKILVAIHSEWCEQSCVFLQYVRTNHVTIYSAVDFITDLPESEEYTMVIVVADRFSCAIKLVPLSTLSSALEVALFHHVFSYYGILEDIHYCQ